MTVLMAMGVAETPGIRRLHGLRRTDLICGPSSSKSCGPTSKPTSAFLSAETGVAPPSGRAESERPMLSALGRRAVQTVASRGDGFE